MSDGRSRVGRLLLKVLASLAIGVLCLEGLARLFFENPLQPGGQMIGMYANEEALEGIRSVPGWRGTMTIEGRTVPVELNALGLRSPEPPGERGEELRLLCLGDSMTFGKGVAGEEAWPAVLGDLLAVRTGREVVVGNAGLPGYGTRDQARVAERVVPAFDPDLVVSMIYLGNDFTDDAIRDRFAYQGFMFTGAWANLFRSSSRARAMMHSQLLLWVEVQLLNRGSSWALVPESSAAELEALAGHPPPAHRVHGLFMDMVDPGLYRDPQGVPESERILGRIRSSLAAIDATVGERPYLVLFLPSWSHLDRADRARRLEQAGMDPEAFRLGLSQERLGALCDELGLPWVDLTIPLEALEEPTSVYLRFDRHLAPQGHALVAEAALEPLLRAAAR